MSNGSVSRKPVRGSRHQEWHHYSSLGPEHLDKSQEEGCHNIVRLQDQQGKTKLTSLTTIDELMTTVFLPVSAMTSLAIMGWLTLASKV